VCKDLVIQKRLQKEGIAKGSLAQEKLVVLRKFRVFVLGIARPVSGNEKKLVNTLHESARFELLNGH
jgi:hypothetical protein